VETSSFGSSGLYPQITIFAPSGAVVESTQSANSQARYTLPETGTYVIRVRTNNLVNTGSYSLGFERLLPLAAVDDTIAPGEILAASISAPAETDLVTFTGNVDDQVQFTLVETSSFGSSGVYPQITIFAPSGAVVGSTQSANSTAQYTLPETGVYVIRVRASNLVSTGTYEITMQN
jgi:hypothetical protein